MKATTNQGTTNPKGEKDNNKVIQKRRDEPSKLAKEYPIKSLKFFLQLKLLKQSRSQEYPLDEAKIAKKEQSKVIK